MWCLKLIKTETKWPQFSGRNFQMHFLEWKCMNFFENFIEFFSNGPINNSPVLVFIMSWRRPGDKPLSEPMMILLLTHICVTRGCDYLSWVDLSIRCILVLANDVQGKHMLFYLYPVHKRLNGYMWKLLMFSLHEDSNNGLRTHVDATLCVVASRKHITKSWHGN